ncbi:MAG: SDR family NAD(P)-dependent oxidoreductase, partial [Dehalococcoidia bacterium]
MVCAWPLAANPARRQRCYDVLTALAAACRAGGRRPAFDVVVLTHGVYQVIGDEQGDVGLGALSGLARTLSMEMPALRIRALDLPAASVEAIGDAIGQMAWWYDEPLLVRRGRRWWRREYVPVAASGGAFAPSAAATSGTGLSVVLGVGQVGTAAARVLARAGHAIVLVARQGPGMQHAESLARELVPLAAVHCETCDVAEPEQVEALLRRLTARHGAIERLILAAGISGERAYQDSALLPDWKSEEHFRIKVDGVAALGASAASYPIRRVVLMSSLSGVLGAISLGPYSAASAAMDSHAERFDGRHADWLSIGWDAWRRPEPIDNAHEARVVEDGLTAGEAETALAHLLLSNATGHVLVAKGDFPS